MVVRISEKTRRGGYVAPFCWELDLFESREILDGSITSGGNPENFGGEEDDSENWN